MEKPITGHFTNPNKAQFWETIFKDGRIPVTAYVPVVNIQHPDFDEPQPAYLLDWESLSEDTRQRVARKLADKFGGQVEDVYLEIKQKGLPIPASDLAVGIPIRMLI